MSKKIRLLISNSVDPWFNISVEDCIFNQMDPKQTVLFLWRNSDTVIIGRAQNPWKECNLKQMEHDGIKLARRRSGGGAVYQDLGNTCFTFMEGKPSFDRTQSAQLVIDALAKLDINVAASGRNDLVVSMPDGPRKISGSAYREKHDRGFYHGTLLRDVDMGRLANYLNPDPKKLAMKGIESVRSRVMNLVEIKPELTHEMFCEAITEIFFAHYGTRVEAEYISPDNMPDYPGFVENFAKQSSWEWNLGHTPEFTHYLEERFVWGGIDLHLNIDKGIIRETKLFTDTLDPTPFELLAQKLIGNYYRKDMLESVFIPLIAEYPNAKEYLEEYQTWLSNAID